LLKIDLRLPAPRNLRFSVTLAPILAKSLCPPRKNKSRFLFSTAPKYVLAVSTLKVLKNGHHFKKEEGSEWLDRVCEDAAC
jgi:hypothetical protein